MKSFLRKNKKILDVKVWIISIALYTVLKKTLNDINTLITIFCDL